MDMKKVFDAATATLGHHQETGALHGDSAAIKALLGAVVEKVEGMPEGAAKLEAAVEAGTGEFLEALANDLQALLTRVGELEKLVAALSPKQQSSDKKS